MRFEDNILKDFQPRFDDYFKDLDRYAEKVFDLIEAKQIPIRSGKSIFTSGYYNKGRDWLIEYYINEAQYPGLEGAILSNIDSHQSAEIEGYQRDAVDKLAAAGQVSRGARIWRRHVASHVGTFWTYRDAQDRFEKRQKLSPEKREAQSERQKDMANWDQRMANDVPKYKSSTLDAIAAYRKWLAKWGEPDRDADQLKIWETEVQEEQRAKLSPPDKTPMDEDLFWSIIEVSGEPQSPETLMAIEARLTDFTPKAIRDFRKMLLARLSEAYRSDVWALAYLLMNGASDDAFEAFRCWLVLCGKDVFHSTLADPDAFDVNMLAGGGCEFALDLLGLPEAAFNRRSKSPMQIARPKAEKLEGPDLDESEFAGHLPRIAELTGHNS